MFEWWRNLLLRLARVPPEPDPPSGAPASVRVFRASRKLYWLRLIRWSAAQALALGGLIFWVMVIGTMQHEANNAPAQSEAAPRSTRAQKRVRNRPPVQAFKELSARVPQKVFFWLWLFKGIGVMVYLGQLALTYTLVRLDYEMRWYVVTDRSLRIRSGVWRIQEMTMSFANLQQVMVSQGPLQRLLGIADVRVQSAGGGGGGPGESGHGQTDTLHTGVFHGVENALEVRDLILVRLRQFRETGLGDPDEAAIRGKAPPTAPEVGRGAEVSADAIAAARDVLQEARELRRVVKRSL